MWIWGTGFETNVGAVFGIIKKGNRRARILVIYTYMNVNIQKSTKVFHIEAYYRNQLQIVIKQGLLPNEFISSRVRYDIFD